jgi:septum formation protein
MDYNNLILASQSPHRQALLKQVGLNFKAMPAKIDERQEEKHFAGPTDQIAQYLSHKKATSLQLDFPQSIIIGSDQTLIFEKKILHKPKTEDEVFARLKLLQGKSHELHTGLCVLAEDQTFQETISTQLVMHPLEDHEIWDYINRDQPLGCAGGYKIEANGPHLFKTIVTPDFYSIIGLPLLSLLSILRNLKNSRP